MKMDLLEFGCENGLDGPGSEQRPMADFGIGVIDSSDYTTVMLVMMSVITLLYLFQE
jgi:hypothetical protein